MTLRCREGLPREESEDLEVSTWFAHDSRTASATNTDLEPRRMTS